MSTLNRVHTWADGEILTHTALNAEFDNILAFLNGGTGLQAANLADRYSDWGRSYDFETFAAATTIARYFTLPATLFDITLVKVGITATLVTGGSLTLDIVRVDTATSVINGAKPVAVASGTESSTTTFLAALLSGKQYAVSLVSDGPWVGSGILVTIDGKVLVRS